MIKLVNHPYDDRILWECPLCEDAPDDCNDCSVGCDISLWHEGDNRLCLYSCRYCEGTKLLSLEGLLALVADWNRDNNITPSY